MSVAQGHPMWCAHYARKTPMIPVHNGWETCLGCGADRPCSCGVSVVGAVTERGDERIEHVAYPADCLPCWEDIRNV